MFTVGAVTEGTDAQAKTSVRLTENGKMVDGQGADTDTIVASRTRLRARAEQAAGQTPADRAGGAVPLGLRICEGADVAKLAYLSALAASPLLGAAVSLNQPLWFSPPPHLSALSLPDQTHRLGASAMSAEEIKVIGSRAPIEHDPYAPAPIEPLRTYEAGASWGTTHPGEFCCASQYETGLDGQAGR